MATVGVKTAYMGILDSTGKLEMDVDKGLSADGVFVADLKSSKGIVSANITGLAATIAKIYGSNSVADSSVGIPAPQVVLSSNDFPHEVVDKVTGMSISSDDGSATSYTSMLPSVPLIVETNAVKDGKSIFFAFFDNTVTRGEENLQTNNTSEHRVVDALTFSANARTSDSANFKIFYEDQTGFDKDKMLAEIFPGYVAPAGSNPVTTGTPSK